MKRLVALLLALIMIIGIAGCSSDTAYSLGDTVSTDIFELTLDNASLAISLENTLGENFFLPKEYNAEADSRNPYVAAKGHTLVAITYTAKNLDRSTVEADDGWGPSFITVEYSGKAYTEEVNNGYSKNNEEEWENIVGLSNLLLQSGEQETRRCYIDIPVEVSSLDDSFKLIFHLPTSDGKTNDYVYKIN